MEVRRERHRQLVFGIARLSRELAIFVAPAPAEKEMREVDDDRPEDGVVQFRRPAAGHRADGKLLKPLRRPIAPQLGLQLGGQRKLEEAGAKHQRLS